ncbi:MAG: hypothetical protein AB1750_10890 [Chloroflexota bacterium]
MQPTFPFPQPASDSALGLLAVFPGHLLPRLFRDDETVPGTTEGIVMMGVLIVLIIVVPIVWTRRRWMR